MKRKSASIAGLRPVYIGVVPVARTPNGGLQFEAKGEIVEWAVKMQRLPDEATLQERLRPGEVGMELVEALARRIASFHRQAETSERIATFGCFEAVARSIVDIFTQATPHVDTTVRRPCLRRVKSPCCRNAGQPAAPTSSRGPIGG